MHGVDVDDESIGQLPVSRTIYDARDRRLELALNRRDSISTKRRLTIYSNDRWSYDQNEALQKLKKSITIKNSSLLMSSAYSPLKILAIFVLCVLLSDNKYQIFIW
jgi:hypothetical protein